MKRKTVVLFLITVLLMSSTVTSKPVNAKTSDKSKQKLDPIISQDYPGNPMLNYDYMVNMIDIDGDGLSDYEEIHKYLTEPNNPDTDGDGIPDGDWEERREYSYSIKVVRELDKPFNSASLWDTFQDIRVIEETKNKLVYEAILYPYATDNVKGNSDWIKYKDYPEFKELLKPRKTTNWDSKMQEQILKSIPKEVKTDIELVEFLVDYYFNYRRKNSTPIKDGVNPVDFYVDLRYEKPLINQYNEFKNGRKDPKVSDDEFIQQILFAKGIFENQVSGACTSDATYMTAVLRAAGIPARIIETNSLLDYTDKDQIKLIGKLKDERIKKIVKEQQPAYYGHYYLEAYVGGRWIKINNNGRLFESNYIEDYPGIFHLKADTFFDYTDTGMWDIWKNGFPKKLPYKLLDISDSFGVHYKPEPPKMPITGEHKILHVKDAFYFGHYKIEPVWNDVDKNSIFLSVEEKILDKDFEQYKDFVAKYGGQIILKSKGQPNVKATSSGNGYDDLKTHAIEFYIDNNEFKKLVPGIKYTLHPVIKNEEYKLIINDGVYLEVTE